MKVKHFIEKYYWLAFIGAFLSGVSLRVYYLVAPTTKLGFDEAVYAFQALNILRGEWTVFYYNQAYTGTLQAYLTAFFYAFFGVNEIWAKLVPLGFSLLYLILTVALSFQIFKNKTISLISLLLASLSTSFWLNWSSRAGSGYNEMITFGQIIFLLTLIIARDDLKRNQKPLYAFVLGLAAGIGFWIQPTIVYFLLPSFLFLLLTRPFWGRQSRLFDISLYASIPGALLGLAPVIWCNLSGCAATFSSLVNKGSLLDEKPWGSFWNLVTKGMPVLLGVRRAAEEIDYVPTLAIGILGLYLIILGSLFIVRNRELLKDKIAKVLSLVIAGLWGLSVILIILNPRQVDIHGVMVSLVPYYLLFSFLLLLIGLYTGLLFFNWFKNRLEVKNIDLLWLFVLSVLLIFIFTPPFNGFIVEPRYISPLYVALPILLASGLERWFLNSLGRQALSFLLKSLAVTSFGLIILSSIVDYQFAPPSIFFYQYKVDNLISYLNRNKIHYIWANNDFAYRLMLETEGSIVAVPHDNYVVRQRVPKYEQELKRAPDNIKALIALRDYRLLPEQCRIDFAHGKTCSMSYFDGFYIYRW